MEIKVILVNVMRYQDKNTKIWKTRIEYIPVEKGSLQNRENFKGFTSIGGYSNRTDIIEKIKEEDMLSQVTLIGEEVQNGKNPFKKSVVLKQLVTKNETIDLL